MTRAEKIKAGRVWQVYPHAQPDNVMFEGSRTACLRFIRNSCQKNAFKRGQIILAQLIWEPEP